MLIVADDIDSLDREDEQAVEFFTQNVPLTGSRVLMTSRRQFFGFGSCTTQVPGMTEEEVESFLRQRAPIIGLADNKINSRLVRQVQEITDGSPLYIEDFLRLAHFYSIEHALDQWAGRRGDTAREYSLRRELEKLSKVAASVLGVLAYSKSAVSLQECSAVVGLTDEQAEIAMDELRSWNLLVKPGLVEGIPRFTCSRNLAKLMRRSLEGTDEEQRLQNGLKGLRGVTFGSSHVRQYTQQAVALQRRGNQEEAEKTLLEGLRVIPNSGEIHAMLGWLYSKWKPNPRVADGVENFERAETLGSTSRNLYAHWADMELRQNEYRRTIAVCERACQSVAQNDDFIWRLAGMAHTRLGEQLRQSLSLEQASDSFERADRALRRAQELSSTPSGLSHSFNARYRLARSIGDYDEASRILSFWKEQIPEDSHRPSR